MSDHILRYIDGEKLFPVIDRQGMSYQLRGNHRTARPCPNHPFTSRTFHGGYLLRKLRVYIRSLFQRTCHYLSPLRCEQNAHVIGSRRTLFPFSNDIAVRFLFRVPGLIPFRGNAPRRNRMTSARAFPFTSAVRVINRVHRHASNLRAFSEPS